MTTNYLYDAANRLTRAGAKNVTSDNAGGVTNDGVAQYTYDSLGRLTSVIPVAGGPVTAYGYDADGNRVIETVGSKVTKYLLDLTMTDARRLAATEGAKTDRYVFGRSLALTFTGPSKLAYQHADGLGSVRLVTNAAHAVVTRSNYMPYGVRLTGKGTYGFTGEPSSAGGTLYLRAREYDPATGRFLSVDPARGLLARPLTGQRYAYALDDPTNRVDPSGRCSVSLGRAWGPDCGKDGKTKCGLLNGGPWNGCDAKLYVAPKGKPKPVAPRVPQVAPKPIPAPTLHGGGIVGNDGHSLITNDGGSLITNDGGSIIGNDGASLITNDGGSLITNDGGSLITNDGGSIIGNDGASFAPSQVRPYSAPIFAESSAHK